MSGEDRGPVDGFQALYADRSPDPALERRVWEEWRASTRRQEARHSSGRYLWLRVAAGLMVFLAGWGLRGIVGEAATPADHGVAYMLMLWEPPEMVDEAPEDVARRYAGWARDVATSGLAVRGDELSEVDRAVVGAPEVASGSFVSGYFVVGASDLTEARNLAQSHPHLERGGWIEVSRVVRR